jgi:hypothetical protein
MLLGAVVDGSSPGFGAFACAVRLAVTEPGRSEREAAPGEFVTSAADERQQ